MAGQLRSQVHVEGRRCGRGLLGCLAPPDISAILGSVCLAWLFVARQKCRSTRRRKPRKKTMGARHRSSSEGMRS